MESSRYPRFKESIQDCSEVALIPTKSLIKGLIKSLIKGLIKDLKK